MIKRISYTIFLLVVANNILCQSKPATQAKTIVIEPGEKWWGGAISESDKAPFSNAPYSLNLFGENKSNQAQPLLISNHGRYVWSEQPFAFSFKNGTLKIDKTHGMIVNGRAGKTLPEVYGYVSKKYFPASGKMPDELLFTHPQWNTWIELTYNQNQNDILKYARNIIANGFEPGVLMIDDTWQENYGMWNFHPGRFPNPKAMMDELHSMGFKIMLWVCPFVSADSPPYRELKTKQAFVRDNNNYSRHAWEHQKNEPAMIGWWNGVSALLDFTNPNAVAWFKAQLDKLQKDYGVDGFKFDAGDAYFYPADALTYKQVLPNTHSELFGEIGLSYPLNEYRAMWKMGGEPLAERLWDKGHTWEDLQKLIPQIAAQGLMGYAFTCPDMIGGGEFTSFLPGAVMDQDLVVRSAQCHALMPMMQFSVAPWRILDTAHLEAVKKAVALRQKFVAVIMQLAKNAAQTNEPIMRHVEYVFPNQGFAEVKDQFMLGDKIMAAPLVTKGAFREVLLPKGNWRADDGKIFNGPGKFTIQVPLDRLPYFEKTD